MSIHFRDIAEQVSADGVITADEILALRREGWSDGRMQPEEAEAIFVINDRIANKTPEWTDFFVEAIAEFTVNGAQPQGYVDEERARWLIARLDHDGRVETLAELELLLKVLDKARNVPDELKAYALAQIEQAVLKGEGPTRDGGLLDAGCINATEAGLLRRMIFAQGGDRPAAVSRDEAEMLFRIKDATLGAGNAPEWKQLFVQGVANYLSGYSSGNAQLTRERAGELESFMNDAQSGVGRFFGRMVRSDIGAGFGDAFSRKRAFDRDAAIEEARAVTDTEQTWLQGQLDADDRRDELEDALMAFLDEEKRLG